MTLAEPHTIDHWLTDVQRTTYTPAEKDRLLERIEAELGDDAIPYSREPVKVWGVKTAFVKPEDRAALDQWRIDNPDMDTLVEVVPEGEKAPDGTDLAGWTRVQIRELVFNDTPRHDAIKTTVQGFITEQSSPSEN